MNILELASLEARVCLPVGMKIPASEDAGYNDHQGVIQDVCKSARLEHDSGTGRASAE